MDPKLRIATASAAVGVLLASCGPAFRTSGYQPTTARDVSCEPKYVYNAVNRHGHAKLGSITFRGSMVHDVCQQLEVYRKIREDACALGAALINVHSIRLPNVFSRRCYYATADFYGATSGFEESPEPIVELPPTPPHAFEVEAGVNVGQVIGPEKEVPLATRTDHTSLIAWGLAARYLHRRVGAELEVDVLRYLRAWQGEQVSESLSGFTGQAVRLGVMASLLRHQYTGATFRIDLGAGASHTWLRVADELNTAVRAAGGASRSDTATGFGYYGHLDLRHEAEYGLITSAGVKFEREHPRFDDMDQALDAWGWELRLRMGYRF